MQPGRRCLLMFSASRRRELEGDKSGEFELAGIEILRLKWLKWLNRIEHCTTPSDEGPHRPEERVGRSLVRNPHIHKIQSELVKNAERRTCYDILGFQPTTELNLLMPVPPTFRPETQPAPPGAHV